MDNNNFIPRLAAWGGQNKFLKCFFFLPYWVYKKIAIEPKIRRKNQVFCKNSLSVLETFDKCMTENNIDYTLAFGTMLGAVREHGFIKHDFDIDVAMWIDQYSQRFKDCMTEYGFTLKHELSVDDGKSGLELTYVYNDVDIDIFFIYPAIDEYPYCCDFLAVPGSASFSHSMERFGMLRTRRLQLPWKREFVRVPFLHLNLPISSNADEILSFRYGEDYMTPNPKWSYCKCENKYTTEWMGKKGIAKYYH